MSFPTYASGEIVDLDGGDVVQRIPAKAQLAIDGDKPGQVLRVLPNGKLRVSWRGFFFDTGLPMRKTRGLRESVLPPGDLELVRRKRPTP